MFCPFVHGDCVSDCVFNNLERTPKDYLESIKSKLDHIDNNTSKDQTDSWQINEKLGCVLDKLNSVLDMM